MRRLFFGLVLSLGTIAVTISPAASQTEDIEDTRTSTAQVEKVGDLNAKVFDAWESEMVLGDCKARRSKLTLYENGSIQWETEIISIDVDDEWYDFFEFFDGSIDGQAPLSSTPERLFSIKIMNRWRTLKWASDPDPQLAEMYQRIKTIRWIARC